MKVHKAAVRIAGESGTYAEGVWAMKALKFVLGGGVAAAALFAAAPASAQYYPGYGGNVVGTILNSVLGGGMGYGGYAPYGAPYGGGYGYNSQAAVSQCTNAVQARLGGGYGYSPYGYNNGYAGGRVLGVNRVEPRSNGGLTVRGVASSGVAAGYGYGQPADLTFKCKTDYRGLVVDVDINRAQGAYGYNYSPYATPNNDPYAAYGYRRY